MSEGPKASLADELCRHPNVEGFSADSAAGRCFRKRYDIYSLSLILIEIAYWKPLESILGISSLKHLKAKDVLQMREVLPSQSHMESLQGSVGDTITHASRACLEGVDTVGQPDKEPDDTLGAVNLQVKLYEAAMRPCSTLVI
ncbi:hypothetical protein F5883DRAFT_684604 [Diaporthe sp. PMI_573]|nr:hypothetical protein F5883DRAFT_684604 [Diaporthaceae sp. PMI_573]